MEVLNPWAGSRMAWVYTVRTVALYLAVYFVAAFAMDSLGMFYKAIVQSILLYASEIWTIDSSISAGVAPG